MSERATIARTGPIAPTRAAVAGCPRKARRAVAASAILARTLKAESYNQTECGKDGTATARETPARCREHPASKARTGSRWKRCTVRHSASRDQ